MADGIYMLSFCGLLPRWAALCGAACVAGSGSWAPFMGFGGSWSPSCDCWLDMIPASALREGRAFTPWNRLYKGTGYIREREPECG